MRKNIIILILLAILLVNLYVCVIFSKSFSKKNNGYGHPYPRDRITYAARDPDDDQIKLIVDATEWTDGGWDLVVLFKTEDNKVFRFWTNPPNAPRDWMADKLETPESMEGKLMSLEEICHHHRPFGSPPIWITSRENETGSDTLSDQQKD
ncbi:MAG TPA: hypothetical protein PKX73_12495 [Anaerohalosphaeraceae bacterium]|nr:hypothetical protein [Anaerohalosphaeraceae bacterium]HQJ69018.1 hypothetical protein [Anaerohalosphaeraceae bacterium]